MLKKIIITLLLLTFLPLIAAKIIGHNNPNASDELLNQFVSEKNR